MKVHAIGVDYSCLFVTGHLAVTILRISIEWFRLFIFMKKHLLVILATAFSVAMNAANIVEIGGIFYDLKPAKVGTASVTSDPKTVGYKQYTGNVVIPSTIEYEGNTYKVTEIDTYAFMGCRELATVELPNSLITIGFGSFDGCTGLTTINIPSSVKTIEKWAFRDCTGLAKVCITDIEAWCGIEFEDYGNPLYYAHHLYIGDEEITELIIPNTVTTICDRAFNGFSSLKTVELGSGIVSIGKYAFAWCTSLISIVMPDNVKELGSCAFFECKALANIAISENIEKINVSTFEKCNSLKVIRIPNGVKEIDNFAFRNCKKLEKIYIADSVERIGAGSFGNCENISDVYCFATTPPVPNTMYYTTISNYFWQSYTEYSTLHVPESSIDSYKSAFTWGDFGKIVALTNEDTGVGRTMAEDYSEMQYYTIDGHNTNVPCRGINIIRMSNGQSKKVLIK